MVDLFAVSLTSMAGGAEGAMVRLTVVGHVTVDVIDLCGRLDPAGGLAVGAERMSCKVGSSDAPPEAVVAASVRTELAKSRADGTGGSVDGWELWHGV